MTASPDGPEDAQPETRSSSEGVRPGPGLEEDGRLHPPAQLVQRHSRLGLDRRKGGELPRRVGRGESTALDLEEHPAPACAGTQEPGTGGSRRAPTTKRPTPGNQDRRTPATRSTSATSSARSPMSPLRDQVAATALMLCLANRVETRQRRTRATRLGRRSALPSGFIPFMSYGNRLFCDNEAGELRHRWGSTKLYRGYYQDYREFLAQTRKAAEEGFRPSDVRRASRPVEVLRSRSSSHAESRRQIAEESRGR